MTGNGILANTEIDGAAAVRRGPYLVAMCDGGTRPFLLAAGRTTTVGRADECDIAFDTLLLSRVHFSVTVQGGELRVRDHDSSNGTKVNGRRIDAGVEVTVDGGALIEAGGLFFVLKDEIPEADLRSISSTPAGEGSGTLDGVVIEDPAMQRLHALVEMIARSNLPVLVTGETGCGKEVISRAVHTRSLRAEKAFVSLNCAALPPNLIESELFGYERGAFTGATQAKQGLIESADGGTLFLDEVGELPLATQAKLLRVLENGEVLRIGAVRPRAVDVRFVAATNRDLPSLVNERSFRRDLYYRLNGVTVPIPPLRERRGEILPLAKSFLRLAAKRANRRAPRIAEDVAQRLTSHPWPGNARELRNVMERALALCSKDVLEAEHLILDIPARSSAPAPAPVAVVEAPRRSPILRREGAGRVPRADPETERRTIEEALQRAAGNQTRAAVELGISRRTLIHRLEELGIARPRKKAD